MVERIGEARVISTVARINSGLSSGPQTGGGLQGPAFPSNGDLIPEKMPNNRLPIRESTGEIVARLLHNG